MRVELGQSTNPRDFVPGDPTGIRSDATAWTAVADRFDDVVFELATIEVEGWKGDAADAFAEKLNEHVKRWQVAAGVYRAAAQAVSTYADHLAGAQRTAQIAIDLYEAGETARTEWNNAQQKAAKAAGHGQASTSLVADPGAGDREEARQLMLSAQQTASAEADLAQDQLSGRAAEIEKLNADILEMIRVSANGVVSVGNAMLQHGQETLWLVAGILGTIVGAGMSAGGGILTLSVVGSEIGIPVGAAGIALTGASTAAAGAAGAALGGYAATSSKVEIWKAVDRGDGRDALGQFADGNPGTSGKAAEKAALDKHEARTGEPVLRDQKRATVDGVQHPRFYDGLQRKPDGTFEGIEVKSGTGSRDAAQREFDGAVSYDNPARVTVDGEEILITSVRLIQW